MPCNAIFGTHKANPTRHNGLPDVWTPGSPKNGLPKRTLVPNHRGK